MKHRLFAHTLLAAAVLAAPLPAFAGQAPFAVADPDIPVGHHDRVYAAEQFSNTVSVTDPADNRLLGVIRLGDPQPGNLSPLYRGQVLVHGMGFSPDPQDDRRGVHRHQLRHLHRHRDQRGKARPPMSAAPRTRRSSRRTAARSG